MGEFGPCLLDRSSGLFCVLVSRGIRTRKGGSKFLAECSLAPHDFLWRFQGREALANPTLGRGGWAVRPRLSACLAPLGSLPRPEESRGGLSGVGCYTEEGEGARLQRLRVSSFLFFFLFLSNPPGWHPHRREMPPMGPRDPASRAEVGRMLRRRARSAQASSRRAVLGPL